MPDCQEREIMRIGVCDDEKEVREFIKEKVNRLLPKAEVILYESGQEVLCEKTLTDILFLDIQMPGTNGMETAKILRKTDKKTVIIFVTAIEEYVFQAFDVEAFHYLVKPFAFEELLARIQCVTRRSPVINQTDLPGYCDIQFNEATNTLTGPGGSCSCSKREGAMLDVLIKNGGQTLSRNMLLLKIWGPDSDVEEGNLDNYIYFVRRRLKAVGSRLNLRTIRGIGYCLMEE